MGSGRGETLTDGCGRAGGALLLALVAALSSPAWSAPTSPSDAADRARYVVTRWSWSSAEDDDRVTTPSLEEALRPAEFGHPQALDASARTNDVDALDEAIESRSRDYLSARAVAKLSQLLFRLPTDAGTIDQAIEVTSIEWSGSPFSAAGGSGGFAATGHASPAFDGFAVAEPARAGGAQPSEESANPIVRFLKATIQYLRENRDWVLGIATGLLALAGLAGGVHARR